MAFGLDLRRRVGHRRRVLRLHAPDIDVQPAHELGLSANRDGIFPRLYPRPIRAHSSDTRSDYLRQAVLLHPHRWHAAGIQPDLPGGWSHCLFLLSPDASARAGLDCRPFGALRVPWTLLARPAESRAGSAKPGLE